MKVCTDACVLGAWADITNAKRILDIGSGTGLLSLMVAQRNAFVAIDAVEIEAEAFLQSGENVAQSIFADRIKLYHEAIQDFYPQNPYDVIITNPPFFQSDLRSPEAKVNAAHHAESLDFQDLLVAVKRLLLPEGKFAILLPVEEGKLFQKMAIAQNWHLTRELTLFHQPGKHAFRLLTEFQRNETSARETQFETLDIYQSDGTTHDPGFKALLKDFYLKF